MVVLTHCAKVLLWEAVEGRSVPTPGTMFRRSKEKDGGERSLVAQLLYGVFTVPLCIKVAELFL